MPGAIVQQALFWNSLDLVLQLNSLSALIAVVEPQQGVLVVASAPVFLPSAPLRSLSSRNHAILRRISLTMKLNNVDIGIVVYNGLANQHQRPGQSAPQGQRK